jgi:septum formation protein
LLASLGLEFEVYVPQITEWSEKHDVHLSPREFVWGNAFRKGRAAQRQHPGRRVLSADTVVCLGTRLLGKPHDVEEAAQFLLTLSGQVHQVLTAVFLIAGNGSWQGLIEITKVEFHRLTAPQVRAYVRKVPVLDKAGAYAIQEHGDLLVRRVYGSLSNVMGLPLERVGWLLQR